MRLQILALVGIVTANTSPPYAAQVSDSEALSISRPQELIVASDIDPTRRAARSSASSARCMVVRGRPSRSAVVESDICVL